MFSEKQEYQRTSLVDIPASWDEYLANKSPWLQGRFGRTLDGSFGDGSCEYIRHRPLPASEGDGDPHWDLFASCESIAEASRPSDIVNGNAPKHDCVWDYFRASHAAAARVGMLDMSALVIEGQPSAFLYGYHYQGNVTATRMRSGSSNGNDIDLVLTLQSLQDSCNRGDCILDLGPGEREHKRWLRTRTESTYRLTYTPMNSWRSQAVRFTRWAERVAAS